MSSKGPQPSTSGMDGQDHAWRQRVAVQYQQSALNKSRLKNCIFFHYFLSFAMLAKLAPYILDRCNWFILTVEELEVPEPYIWEWVWLSSFLPSIFCLDAIKKNSVSIMKYYIAGILLLGYVPILYAIVLWFPEVWTYLFSDDYFDHNDIIYWKLMQLLTYLAQIWNQGKVFLTDQLKHGMLYLGYLIWAVVRQTFKPWMEPFELLT